MTRQRKKCINEAADGQVRLDYNRGRHHIGHRSEIADASHHAGGSSQEEHADEEQPESNEISTKSRRQSNVESESDQHQRHKLATEAGDAGGVTHAAASFPDNGAEHAATIEWITRKQVENCQ